MRKIGVIGLGHVGSTVAYTLITKGIADEHVLIDQKDALCTAEYYDYSVRLGGLTRTQKLSNRITKRFLTPTLLSLPSETSNYWRKEATDFWNTHTTAVRPSQLAKL